MTHRVADIRANLNENIRHAVDIIGRSDARLRVFKAIYAGKRPVKTVLDLMASTEMPRVRVLQEGKKLADNEIVEQVKQDGKVAYQKVKVYSQHKSKVLQLVKNPNKKSKYPTKQEPATRQGTTYRITVTGVKNQPEEITVDDITAFKAVRSIPLTEILKHQLSNLPETRIKEFLKKIIGETYQFKDWGGERNDLFTTKLRFHRSRISAAFAIKGKATKGKLTPKKMGKNGDQIGRLVMSPARMLLVVYHGKVDESIYEQLRAYAIARSMSGQRVYYCVIDGADLSRLIEAYSDEFAATG